MGRKHGSIKIFGLMGTITRSLKRNLIPLAERMTQWSPTARSCTVISTSGHRSVRMEALGVPFHLHRGNRRCSRGYEMRRLFAWIIGACGVATVVTIVVVALFQSQSSTLSAQMKGTATIIAPTVAGTARSTLPLPTGPGAPTLVIPSGVPRPQTGPPPTRDPNGVPSIGLTGITPRNPNAGPATPAYTAQDAIDYVSTHSFVATKADSTGPITIVGVQFLTTSQLQSQLGVDLPYAPDRLLCVVEIAGTFSVYGPTGAPTKSTRAYEFFDAHTGNYLGVNIRP